VDAVSRASGLAHAVRSAGREQASTIGVLDDTLRQLIENTRENFALVRDLHKAADALASHGMEMYEQMERFQYANAPG
jgi:methyl-accepting chemotaxis protein